MEQMTITTSQYIDYDEDGINDVILATIDGITMSVPLDPANRHYAEIMRKVEAGELVIADPD
jgi:hypothetical protein